MDNKVPSPHDRLFHGVMTNPLVAKDFFTQHLPQKLQEKIDLNSLLLCKESFVDNTLSLSIVDLLYAVNFKFSIQNEEIGYIYLLTEHQSTASKLMPFRLLQYICKIMDYHLEINKTKILPVVYPLIFYNGSAQYQYSTDIFDLFGSNQALAREVFVKPAQLIDLSQHVDEELKQYPKAGFFELMMKYIYAKEMLPHFKDALGLLRELDYIELENYILSVIKYVLSTGQIADKQALIQILNQALPKPLEEKTMGTMADMWIEEGIEKGIQKGAEFTKRDIARKLLAKTTDIILIAQVTGLSKAQIRVLEKEIAH